MSTLERPAAIVAPSVAAAKGLPASHPFIPPGSVLGVMGGGQLARMFVHAAQRMGYVTAVLEPDRRAPAVQAADRHVEGGYDTPAALMQLVEQAAAITTEFENVPAESLAWLSRRRPIAPGAGAVAICQDRAAEKALFAGCGVPCAPHALIVDSASLEALEPSLLPGILKTTRLGYDGKGQVRVANKAQLAEAWATLGRVECILEKLLPLAHEISVIVARGSDGAMVHLPVQQNLHRDGILAVTQVPAPDVSAAIAMRAVDAAERLATGMHYVGVLCVEFFVLADGSLIANEMAPRPHNSGHYSIDGCDLSQFDLQVRTLTNAPLSKPRLHSACVMLNLLGDLWADAQGPDWRPLLALPGVHLHLYGKHEARPGRKMGHLTVTATGPDEADRVAVAAAALLGIPPW